MDTRDTIRNYLTSKLIRDPKYKRGDKKLGDSDKLLTGSLIDSFAYAELALFLEEQFGVSPDNTELNAEYMDTVQMIADYVESHRK